jgi:phage-related minor tail protein
LVWKQLELRRTLPRELQEALTRADRLAEALHQHRLARLSHRLPDVDDTESMLAARVAKTLDEAARALHDASNDAEDSIERTRRSAVEEIFRYSGAERG